MRCIRPVRFEEAQALSSLCKRSKAHWGYDSEFMRRAEASLTVTTQEIAQEGVLVCEDENSITGVISVVPMADEGVFDLMHLFVEPHAIGKGVGRALFLAAVSLMRERGGTKLLILSDPNAAEFYRRMGAIDIGEASSDAIPERLLPLLVFVFGSWRGS